MKYLMKSLKFSKEDLESTFKTFGMFDIFILLSQNISWTKSNFLFEPPLL